MAFQHVAITQILIEFLSLEHSEAINRKLSTNSNRNIYFISESFPCAKQFLIKISMLHSSSVGLCLPENQ